MPGFILHQGAVLTCPHGGKVTVVPVSPPRVQVTGLPVQAAADQMAVTGCSVPICATVLWQNLSARVMVNGQPIALQAPPGPGKGDGSCLPPAVPPLVLTIQPRVIAT
ncbi:hypothetical protein ACFWY9_33320 [Amycolatopsis sp. NPDC059027]|uniref:hypothetical protein n=1 Tax=Amycolatopsis sp. NPDC059027 TaxID=3346709 RepID=UPI00366DC4C5